VGFSQLEMKVEYGWMGLAPGADVSYWVRTTDWSARPSDESGPGDRAAVRGSLHASEASVAPFSVLQGERGVPMLRIDLENRGAVGAEVGSVRATLAGTLAPSGIEAVRLWTGPRDAVAFDQAACAPVAVSSPWEGRTALVTPSAPVSLGPGESVSLWLTVDVAAGATTVDWFDLWVMADGGLGTMAELVVGEVHGSYRLVRVWNATGDGRYTVITHICINEFYPNPGSGEVEWVELINPTSSDISLKGWYVDCKPDANKTNRVVSFSNTDTIAGNRTVKAWDASGTDDISDKGSILLYNNKTMIDAIRYKTVSGQSSHARARDSNDDPTDLMYTTSSPTKGTKNELVPEFGTVAGPALVTVVAFALVRRRAASPGRVGGGGGGRGGRRGRVS